MAFWVVGFRGIEPLAATTPHFNRNGFTVRYGEGSPQGQPHDLSKTEGMADDTALRSSSVEDGLMRASIIEASMPVHLGHGALIMERKILHNQKF